jgi:hypothetical protein
MIQAKQSLQRVVPYPLGGSILDPLGGSILEFETR